MDFLRHLFDTSDFTARWDCGRGWTPPLGWLHILSDLGVWSAYLAIPCVLGYFILRRRDMPFRSIFILFGLFILACGTTHLMDALVFWWPAYRLSALIRLITAVVSWATVLALIPITPRVLAMRGPDELQHESDARARAEDALRLANADLERRVLERTAALERSNAELFDAVAELRALVELSPVAIFRAEDKRADVITGNAAGYALLGMNPASNISLSAPDRIGAPPPYTVMRDGKLLTPDEMPLQHVVRTGEAVRDWELDIHFPGAEADTRPPRLETDSRSESWSSAAAWNASRVDVNVKHLVAHAMPLFDRKGNVRAGYLIAVDVTSLKRLQRDLRDQAARLQEADRRKDEFLATLAHELRNPLAPLRNSLYILKVTGGAGEHGQVARETMERQLHHLVRLVDDLLDVSRISRGKLELRKARVEMAGIVYAALETSRPVVESFQHRLHVELPQEPLWLDGDQVRLAQVVSNLVNNAAKYTDPSGDIWVKVETTGKGPGSEAVLRVRDAGLGIPADMLERVFDVFAQVHRSLDRTKAGLGIGLMLVRRLVELHGGTVVAASEGPGKGSEFTVRLPLAEPPAVEAPEPAPSPHPPTPPRRILVVDDNRDAAESLADILRTHGHEVMVTYDGPSALVLADANPPDIAVLDLGLPHMSGHEIAAAIRGRDWGKSTFLIALTGWGQEADKKQTQASGFDAHLVKPVEIDVLLGTLK